MYAARLLVGLASAVATMGFLGGSLSVDGTLPAEKIAIVKAQNSGKLVTLGELTGQNTYRLAAIRQAARQQLLTQTKASPARVAAVYRVALPTKQSNQVFLTKHGVKLTLGQNAFNVPQVTIPYRDLTGKISNHYLPQTQRTTAPQAGKVIALTFDDGPDPKLTPHLLKILKKAHVHATFFEVGQSVQRYPQITRDVVAGGHELGNHSWNHPDFGVVGTKKTVQQVNRTNAAIYAATGQLPEYVRPPYGDINRAEGQAVEQPIIRWSVDSKDWAYLNKDRDISSVVGAAQNGGIILMHDVHAPSVAAVPAIIHRLKAKGYRFVTVSQLLNHQTLPGRQYFERGDSRVVGK